MGATYTSTRNRGRRRGGSAIPDSRGEFLLLVTAVVAIMAILVCYSGRLRAFETSERRGADLAPVNLSTVASEADLDAALRLVFDYPADRRLAARELFASLSVDGARTAPPNVGTIARITVPVRSLEQSPAGSVYAARLRSMQGGGTAGSGTASSGRMPLFTSADIGALKPALTVRTREAHRRIVFWCAVAFVCAFPIVSVVWRYRRMRGDRVLLSAAFLLTLLGFLVMLSRPDPLRDALLLVRYTQGILIALGLFLAASLIDVRRAAHLGFSYLPLSGALLLAIALIVFGSGPGTSGARINLGPIQPTEAIRLLLALFLAGYFARRWEVIRQLRGTEIRNRRIPAWLDLPRPDHVLPVLVAVFLALVLFFALKDLGPALLLSLMFLSMFALARGGVGIAAAGMALLTAGFYLGHKLGISSTLSSRIAMWASPWDNTVRGGDQVAQAAWAMAAGAGSGTGLGLGDARYIPAGHTDLVLASIGEELGVIGILAVAVAFAVIAWRGVRISRAVSTDYGFFLAIGMTLSLIIPLLVMAGGVLGVIPLTGVVTPFLSYGGSAMVVNFLALGLLVAAGSRAGADRGEPAEPFRVPLRWLGRTLLAAGVVLVVAWARVQIISADTFLVRAQLSQQADGGLRYQYNPRVLDVARAIPRGTVSDRTGIPLATDDTAAVQARAEAYRRMGVSLAEACPDPSARCYPLGGRTFHLLGDARTQVNWAASNTSYVERDAEDRLRGFDDGAVAVRTSDAAGVSGVALRRDYSALVPLVRHRWEPDHPDVRVVLDRSRDIRLTIDAPFQHQVSAILSRAANSARVERAAAVVLDAATGEVLASVSYPWPGATSAGAVSPDAALDRARYGLYPPGSTFKLVTAAAALRLDPGLAQLPLVCARLPDGRNGVRIPGWGRPIRDDVLDRRAHGAISMHDGLVRSCNAYFAQLAVKIGADALAGTAGLAGISIVSSTSSNAPDQTLPHAGYGQGQVLATPLRMARVAAAIGSDGVIRELPLVQGASGGTSTTFVSASSARMLAGFMRDAVSEGTGRLLAPHRVRIAGKTGTAEVDEAASHAWFVGFAPHGAATRRIAFAVILENAGYGGASAASVAGQIVTAAASLELVR